MSEKFSPSYVLLSQISQLFCLILSHPLYFSYFLFFSPYLFKVFSFLSPLFTTTFLLILAFFFTLSNSHQNQDDDHGQSTSILPQHNEWFNTLFNTPLEIPINPFQVEDQEHEIKKEINISISHVNKQEAKDDDDDDDDDIRENGIDEMGVNKKESFLGFGLVDEEKMDLLWEKYEEKEKLVVEEKNDEKRCKLKKDLRSLVNLQKEMEEEEEEEKESGKICCLQALKFSSGKMRFGMGKKSGLKKISKAFKGLKLLHQLANNGNNKTHS